MDFSFDPKSYFSWAVLFLIFFGMGLIVRD